MKLRPEEKKTLEQLGGRIIAKRQARSWRFGDLASESRLSPGTVRKVESGETNSGIITLRRIARALGTNIIELIEGRKLQSMLIAEVFPEKLRSKSMKTGKAILDHERTIAEWERKGRTRQLIHPFFSALHQTEAVIKYIRNRGFYNYLGLEDTRDIEELESIIELRRQQFETVGFISQEIASSYELEKFVNGFLEFRELGFKERIEQLDNLIKIIEENNPRRQISLLKEPIYTMRALYGTEFVTIRGRGICLEITDEDLAASFSENFTDLWEECISGNDLLELLRNHRENIQRKMTQP
jgi:transcriptional regulator with XRE-family HTH domain